MNRNATKAMQVNSPDSKYNLRFRAGFIAGADWKDDDIIQVINQTYQYTIAGMTNIGKIQILRSFVEQIKKEIYGRNTTESNQ